MYSIVLNTVTEYVGSYLLFFIGNISTKVYYALYGHLKIMNYIVHATMKVMHKPPFFSRYQISRREELERSAATQNGNGLKRD